MTPIDALKILEVISGRAHATRDEHVAVANALQTIHAAITPPVPAPETATPPLALVP